MTRRARLAVLGTAALLALAAMLACAWLLRDPEPTFRARRSHLAAVTEGAPTRDGASVEQEVRLRAASGLEITLGVRRPAAGDSGRRVLFLLLGGHQRGRDAGKFVGETRGAVIASLEYPYRGDPEAKGLAVVAQVPAIRQALFDTPPAVLLALDYLLARSDVDSARVELVGASFGAPFATIAAALDPRVTRLWLLQGGGEPYALFNRGLADDIGFAPARAAVAALATLLASGPRLAPERWIARVSPRPVVMINGLADDRIPRHAVETLYRAAREPKELTWLSAQHMQPNRPEVLRALAEAVLDRAARPAAVRDPGARSR
ncbi:MAG TPA: hypothetical protein VJL28_14395 [Gemmatimonadaceae bacterium]|nr:hypothetical protein [Gemmatimonadaceae bacterium]